MGLGWGCGYSQSHGWPTTPTHVTGGVAYSPSPLIPLPSRERGIWLVLSCSPVSPCRPSGLRIKSAMTGRGASFSPSPLILCHQGRGDMVVFRFVKSCVHALFLCGVCPINLMVDRRICGRAGFSYLYSFHCSHLAPLVSRHAGIVGAGSSERYQNPPAT